jgi:hypothetical protein
MLDAEREINALGRVTTVADSGLSEVYTTIYCFLHIFPNLHLTNYLHNSGFWFSYLRSTL